MRLIDADELRKNVLKWMPSDPCGKEEKEFPFETDICVSMIMEIDETPTIVSEQNWILCSERMPDKMGDYLVTLCDDGRTWVEVALWNETFGGRWQVVLYNDVDYSDISNVIAWMPLPEPYQAERREK